MGSNGGKVVGKECDHGPDVLLTHHASRTCQSWSPGAHGDVDEGPTSVDDVLGGNGCFTGATSVSPTTPQSGATERDREPFGAPALAQWDGPAGRPTVDDKQPRMSVATTPNAESGRVRSTRDFVGYRRHDAVDDRSYGVVMAHP
jgi:hypothetical protein